MKIHALRESTKLVFNLLGEFASGSEDELRESFGGGAEFIDDGEKKGGGFASAGVSETDDIATF